MTTFTLWGAALSADSLAGELERMAGMLRDGFTSGEVTGGWWESLDLADDDDSAGLCTCGADVDLERDGCDECGATHLLG